MLQHESEGGSDDWKGQVFIDGMLAHIHCSVSAWLPLDAALMHTSDHHADGVWDTLLSIVFWE
jgi:hypothetical protein